LSTKQKKKVRMMFFHKPLEGQKTGENHLSQIILHGGLNTASKTAADTAKPCHLFCGTVHVLVQGFEGSLECGKILSMGCEKGLDDGIDDGG
jgi:hypothetical protein